MDGTLILLIILLIVVVGLFVFAARSLSRSREEPGPSTGTARPQGDATLAQERRALPGAPAAGRADAPATPSGAEPAPPAPVSQGGVPPLPTAEAPHVARSATAAVPPVPVAPREGEGAAPAAPLPARAGLAVSPGPDTATAPASVATAAGTEAPASAATARGTEAPTALFVARAPDALAERDPADGRVPTTGELVGQPATRSGSVALAVAPQRLPYRLAELLGEQRQLEEAIALGQRRVEDVETSPDPASVENRVRLGVLRQDLAQKQERLREIQFLQDGYRWLQQQVAPDRPGAS